LIIVAYGMNDVGRKDPDWFADQTRKIIDHAAAASPETEILLVSPMLGNKEWIHTPREMFALYRDQLKSLVSPGVALADVTEVWTLLLRKKHDLDLTGNGLNHPNDFGHRLYAQTVLQLLTLQ
jgi:lysophospholipase L1-like esterase